MPSPRSSRRAPTPVLFLLAAGLLVATTAAQAPGQSVLERSPNLPAGWVGLPGYFYSTLPHRFTDAQPGEGIDVHGGATFDLAMGLPARLLAGGRFAFASATVDGQSDEGEVYLRWAPLGEEPRAPVYVGLTGSYNTASRALDAAASVARWVGPVRVIGEARALSDAFGAGEARFAVGGGGVLHVRPGGIPIALAADAATLLDREEEERVVWSAGVQTGLPFSGYTLSLHASNAANTTIEGRSRARPRTWWGFELTVPALTFGRLLGVFAPRERALESVTAPASGEGAPRPTGEATPVEVDMRRYAYLPGRLVVAAGTTLEWVNSDDVVHTVNAEDGTFHSGAIQPGQRWRARFDAPGRYPYYCGPHPFMQGVVIVR